MVDWGDGVLARCSFTRAMDGRILRCSTVGSCQSIATSMTVKRGWSGFPVRRTILGIPGFSFSSALNKETAQ